MYIKYCAYLHNILRKLRWHNYLLILFKLLQVASNIYALEL